MTRWMLALATLVASTLLAAGAWAATAPGKRVALIIGNSNYQNSVPLTNPRNDAELMAETLKSVGFSIILGTDLDKAGMNAKLDEFTEAAYDAEIALFYYAGHGMQANDENYLIPVDAKFDKVSQLQTRTITLEQVQQALPPDPAVSIVILDACRDNPLARMLAASAPASRSLIVGTGLAPVMASSNSQKSGGMLIAYATDPKAVAYDGKEPHSPYTAALARHLVTPGVEIQTALTRVRKEVSDKTGGAQNPWHHASLAREVFLGGETPVGAPVMQLGEAGSVPEPKPDANVDWTVEQTVWDEASRRNTIQHYEYYLSQFPSGRFVGIAHLNIEQLKQAAARQPAGEAKVAAAEPDDAQPSAAASQVRTAVNVPDDAKTVPGTAETEALLNLDRERRIDLQLRLSALGQDVGVPDGHIGPRTRSAIGAWQRQAGVPETTYLTPQQHMLLVVQTDPLMAQVRANQAARAKASAAIDQPAPRKQKTQVAKRTKRQVSDDYVEDRTASRRKVGRVRENGGFMDSPAGAAFVGGLVGGAVGGLLAR